MTPKRMINRGIPDSAGNPGGLDDGLRTLLASGSDFGLSWLMQDADLSRARVRSTCAHVAPWKNQVKP